MHISQSLFCLLSHHTKDQPNNPSTSLLFSYKSVQALQFGFLKFYFLIKMEALHSSFLSAVVINTDQKQQEEERVYLILFQVTVQHCRRSGQELWKATEEGHVQLTPWLMLSWIYYNPAHLPRNSAAHSGLGLPTSITNQDNFSQTRLQANMVADILCLRVPLPRGKLCQVDNNN